MMKSATLMDTVSKEGIGKNTGLMQLEENGQNVKFMDVEIKRRSELMCMWRGGITPSSCQLVGDVTQILYWITMETRQFGFLPNLTVLLSGLRHTQLQENNSYIRDALKNGLLYGTRSKGGEGVKLKPNFFWWRNCDIKGVYFQKTNLL